MNDAARAIAMRILARIRTGQLTILEGEETTVLGEGAPQATVHILDPRAWPKLLKGGRGMAEAYMDGLWDTPDLTALIRVAARNVGQLDELRHKLTPLREPFQRARAAFSRNTPHRNRRDIAAHYDLGNDLFELMLDPTLMYSCAVFEQRDARSRTRSGPSSSSSAASSTSAPATTCWRSAPAGAASRCTRPPPAAAA